jgi:hypothetical protein
VLSFVLVSLVLSGAYVIAVNRVDQGPGDGTVMIIVLNSCTLQVIPGAIITIGDLRYVTNTFGATVFMVQPGSFMITINHSGYYSRSLLTASSAYPSAYTIFLVPLNACYP